MSVLEVPSPEWMSEDLVLLENATGKFLEAEIELALGRRRKASDILEELAYRHPELRQEIAEDSRFQELRRYYSFRVQMGLEPPRSIGNLELPRPQPRDAPATGDSKPGDGADKAPP